MDETLHSAWRGRVVHFASGSSLLMTPSPTAYQSPTAPSA